jgi:hypothetical protein
LNALTNFKRNENENVDEFNNKFDKIVQDTPQTHQPTPATFWMYCMNDFQGNFSFFLDDVNSIDLIDVKKKSKSLDESWNLSGNPDILSPPKTKIHHKKKHSPTTKPPPNPTMLLVE